LVCTFWGDERATLPLESALEEGNKKDHYRVKNYNKGNEKGRIDSSLLNIKILC